jgi:hypothetical protein
MEVRKGWKRGRDRRKEGMEERKIWKREKKGSEEWVENSGRDGGEVQ